jgi:diaminopimelate decarboxylase
MPAEVALHYAVKANPFRPLIRHLAGLVDGFDVASIGEWRLLESLEAPVSFAGPGKTSEEIELAVAAGITLNVESEAEAAQALELGRRMDVRPRLAIRVNPPFVLKGAGMKMGGLASPFGIDSQRVPALVRKIVEAGAEWRGLHIFAGSQSLSAEAIAEAQRLTVALAAQIAEEAGAEPPEVNLGGGFGIPYFPGDRPIDLEHVGAELGKTLAARPAILRGTRFAVELGRWLVGEAGVYLTRIVDRKESGGVTFLVTDGGLHHMLAASGNFGQLLRRNYPVALASGFGAPAEEEVTIVGCLCTPLDLLADSVMLPRSQPGDLVAIFCAGAYGLTASPQQFLGHPPAREVLV